MDSTFLKDSGTWMDSARNITTDNNRVTCELQTMNGNWIQNTIVMYDKYKYSNINGRFQWTFDNSILFIIINMKKNTDRWENINNAFKTINNKYNCTYIRVEGVDGRNMENDASAKELLKPREHLIGNTFHCCESNEHWTYDGAPATSFPGLFLKRHYGTKGLTVSNMKCFDVIQKYYPDFNWYCILEDDCDINETTYNTILNTVNKTNSLNDILVLDDRGKCGTSAIVYNQRIINDVIEHLHPLSPFSIENEGKYKMGTNLWDYKLWSYLDNFKIANETYPIVKSGLFKSEIG